MVARSILSHHLKYSTTSLILTRSSKLPHVSPKLIRTLATAPKRLPQSSTSSSPPAAQEQTQSQSTQSQESSSSQQKPARQPPWLTRKLRENPTAMKAFLGLARAMGYGSKKQLAGRRALVMYQKLCANRPDEDKVFWQEGALWVSLRHLYFPWLRSNMSVGHMNNITNVFDSFNTRPYFII